ncbi:SxtJ family membrane protein [Methylomonas sp. 11b]|uniref:SxtJ family membrane protein n=1 Tax=Methylomonas sp. 11b TaxID=1168169 RepID=UPI0004794EE8|nr:SxtJ family membrane protein [Methylomonas sp. 11b]
MRKSTYKRSGYVLENSRQEENAQKPSERGFGITFAAIFCIIGFLRLYQSHDLHDHWWMIWLFFAAVLLILAYFWVAPLRPLNNLWHRFGLVLSYLINPIIMGVVFLLTILPVGLLMRFLKKDLLKLKVDRKSSTYWQNTPLVVVKQQNMKNQF